MKFWKIGKDKKLIPVLDSIADPEAEKAELLQALRKAEAQVFHLEKGASGYQEEISTLQESVSFLEGKVAEGNRARASLAEDRERIRQELYSWHFRHEELSKAYSVLKADQDRFLRSQALWQVEREGLYQKVIDAQKTAKGTTKQAKPKPKTRKKKAKDILMAITQDLNEYTDFTEIVH